MNTAIKQKLTNIAQHHTGCFENYKTSFVENHKWYGVILEGVSEDLFSGTEYNSAGVNIGYVQISEVKKKIKVAIDKFDKNNIVIINQQQNP